LSKILAEAAAAKKRVEIRMIEQEESTLDAIARLKCDGCPGT
jgi:hypothetical protein